MRASVNGIAEQYGLPTGVEGICVMLIAERLGGKFYSKDIYALGGFSPFYAIRTLCRAGLLCDAPGANCRDARTRPLVVTDLGRAVIAKLEAAMAGTNGERLAA